MYVVVSLCRTVNMICVYIYTCMHVYVYMIIYRHSFRAPGVPGLPLCEAMQLSQVG